MHTHLDKKKLIRKTYCLTRQKKTKKIKSTIFFKKINKIKLHTKYNNSIENIRLVHMKYWLVFTC